MPEQRHKALAGRFPDPIPKPRYELDKKLARRHAITRDCTQCELPLSRYNPNTTCWHHDYEDRATA